MAQKNNVIELPQKISPYLHCGDEPAHMIHDSCTQVNADNYYKAMGLKLSRKKAGREDSRSVKLPEGWTISGDRYRVLQDEQGRERLVAFDNGSNDLSKPIRRFRLEETEGNEETYVIRNGSDIIFSGKNKGNSLEPLLNNEDAYTEVAIHCLIGYVFPDTYGDHPNAYWNTDDKILKPGCDFLRDNGPEIVQWFEERCAQEMARYTIDKPWPMHYIDLAETLLPELKAQKLSGIAPVIHATEKWSPLLTVERKTKLTDILGQVVNSHSPFIRQVNLTFGNDYKETVAATKQVYNKKKQLSLEQINRVLDNLKKAPELFQIMPFEGSVICVTAHPELLADYKDCAIVFGYDPESVTTLPESELGQENGYLRLFRTVARNNKMMYRAELKHADTDIPVLLTASNTFIHRMSEMGAQAEGFEP